MNTTAADSQRAARCPDLASLEAVPLAASVREHVEGCPSCKLVLEVFEDRGNPDDCLRFDALLAGRNDGTLNAAGKNLLERHLASCDSCRAVAETLSPIADAHGDHATLPRVDPEGYALGLEVARGGMGRIIAARDLRVGRPVAVKELLGRSPHLAARFEREARVTARLQHPGIVPIYEIGRWPDGTPFYTMRMVDGRTLREAIERATTPAARLALLSAVIAACEAVAFAHSQRVIHRDLTPSNVLVGAYGETVVIDWGLAKDLAQATTDEDPYADPYRSAERPAVGSDLTGAGAIVGTLAYMPPEQASAEPVDERADVYSLGAILYHLLAGVPAYRARTADELLAQVKAADPAPIDRIAPGAPRDLVSIVSKAMARSPDARYPSARELAEELKRFQTGRMVEAHDYSRAELVKRFVRRNRAAVIVTALAAFVLATFGTISVNRILRSREDARVTARELVLEKGRIELLNGDSLRALAYLYDASERGATGRALDFLLGAALSDIAPSERMLDCQGDVRLVELSPDGKHVAAACSDVGKIWNLETGALVASLPGAPAARIAGGFDLIAYSHDGTRVATWGADGVARLWDVRTGALRAQFAHGAAITFTTFTPDDKQLATSGNDGFARVWDVASGRELVKVEGTDSSIVRRLFGVLDPVTGKTLLTITFEGQGKGWDATTGAYLGGFDHGGYLAGGKLSPDGKLAITCDLEGVAKIWDATTGGAPKRVLVGHTDVVWKCLFSPDSRRVLTASHDGTAKIWDVATGAMITSVPHGDVIWIGSFAPDGRRFVTVGVGNRVKVWDTLSGALLSTHDSHGGKDAMFSLDGKRLVVLRGDERIQIWSMPTTRVASFEPPRHGKIIAVGDDGRSIATEVSAPSEGFAAGPDGERLALWRDGSRLTHDPIATPIAAGGVYFAAAHGGGGGVAIIEASSGRTLRTLASSPPAALRFTADGGRLVVISSSAAPEVFDVTTGASLAKLAGATDAILAADGRRALAWLSMRTPPTVWDVDARTRIVTLPAIMDAEREVPIGLPIPEERPIGFAAGGNRIVLVERARDLTTSISVWDASSGVLAFRLEETKPSATLDPSGTWLTSIRDDIVTIQSVVDGGVLASFPGEQLRLAQASADGSLVAGVDSHDRSVAVLSGDGRLLARWPIAHPAAIVTQDGFKAPPALAWWSADSKTVVSRSTTVDIWNAMNPHGADTVAEARKNVPWRIVNGRLELIQNGRLVARLVRGAEPVANARIQVVIRRPADVGGAPINWGSMRARVTTRDAISDGEGKLVIEQLLPGEYTLTLVDSKEQREVRVSADEQPQTVNFAR